VVRLIALFLTIASIAAADPFPPHKVIGNVYYVGDFDLASFLIVTPKGSILVNTGYEFSVPEIRDRIKQLGFRPSDVKILLVTHAHSDHAAGMASMKRLTGAKMWAIEQEAPLLESGGKTDYLFGSNGWFKPVKVDHVFHDGDKIELGGTEITAILTPGHTKGSTSYSFDVSENDRTYRVLIANLGVVNPGTPLLRNPKYPAIVEDYQRTFAIERNLPCDVFLSSHAGQFGLLAKYRPGMPYDANRFVDPDGYYRIVDKLEQKFLDELQQQREEDQAWRDHLHFKDITPPK
jgi:metallo-beta-lactamase class B